MAAMTRYSVNSGKYPAGRVEMRPRLFRALVVGGLRTHLSFNTEQPRDDDHRPAVLTGNSHRHWSNCAWADTKDHARRYERRRHERSLPYRGQSVGKDFPVVLRCENQLGLNRWVLLLTETEGPLAKARGFFVFANFADARNLLPDRSRGRTAENADAPPLRHAKKRSVFSRARYA